MGINAELIRLLADLRRRALVTGNAIVETGAQDVCVVPEVLEKILETRSFSAHANAVQAAELYAHLGFDHYRCIDANGGNGALVFDLNKDLREQYEFGETFDLVTNLGTAEHCFDQHAVFKNLHDLCKPGGIMIHALPAQGNVNHGFYGYNPRFFADLAAANGYEIVDLSFTVDYKPVLIQYTKAAFQKWDSHDLLFYAVFRKMNESPFRVPFDGMFASANRITGYVATSIDPLATEFSPYLKGGDWENTKGIVRDESDREGSRVKAFFRRLISGLS